MAVTFEEKIQEVICMLQNHFKEYELVPEADSSSYPIYYSDVKNLTNIDYLYVTKGYLDKLPNINLKLEKLSDKDDIAHISQFVDNIIYFHEDEVVVGYLVGESLGSIVKNLSALLKKNGINNIGESDTKSVSAIIDVLICDKLKEEFPLLRIVDRPDKQKTFLIGYHKDIEIDLGKKTGLIFKLIRNLCTHHDFFQEVFELLEDIKLPKMRKDFIAAKGTSEEVKEVVEYIEGVVSNTNKVIKRKYKLVKMITVQKMKNDSKKVKLTLNKVNVKTG